MIPRADVTDAVLAALRSTGRRVGDGQAPVPADVPYSVLEVIPAPGETIEDFGMIHRNGTLRFRVCSVGRDPSDQQLARRQAQREGDELAAVLTAPAAVAAPDGAGWSVRTLRHEADGGVEVEGPVVNAFHDYLLTINGG